MRPCVLVLEADPLLRQYLHEALQTCGYDVAAVDSAAAAEAWLAGAKVDLVLLDVLLQDQEGLRLLSGLRKHHPLLPLVAMSARGRSDLSIDSLSVARAMGVDATLEKPFTLAELERTLAYVRLLKPR